LVAGKHDIEGWLLKTLKAMAVSGNLARGRVKLPGTFERDIDVIELLDRPDAWPPAAGLYFIMPAGARFVNKPRFRVQPLYGDSQEEIYGLWASFVGLEFVIMIAAPKVDASPDLRRWLYRPSALEVCIGSSRRLIQLSWEDGLAHAPVRLTVERSVQA
jgi:hypothetical protein